jgi:hypothetical protein
MKYTYLFIFTIALISGSYAQTDSCKVLLPQIAGHYEGPCKNGFANGKGESHSEDTYTGNFQDGLPDGDGKYIYKNGDIFEGRWKAGKKEGKGKFKYTLNGKKSTISGYWKNDLYVGNTDPDLEYNVTSVSGIIDHKVERQDGENKVIITIKSAFADFSPSDLKVETSTGQQLQSGKKIIVDQYSIPLHLEVSYSIVIANARKQCGFIVDILKPGNYAITLSND